MHDNARWQTSARWNEPVESGGFLTLADVKTILRRYGRLLALCIGVCVAIAVFYSLTSTRQYTAYARILIDTPRSPAVGGDASQNGGGGLAVQEVESQIQVLQSDRISVAVYNYLKSKDLLPKDRVTDPTLVDRIVGIVPAAIRMMRESFSGPAPEIDRERAALEQISDRMSVKRLGTSYVLEVTYTSPDPGLAAEAANAFARSYVNEEVESRATVWRRASTWLEERVHELRKRSEEAARAAQDFKAQNGSNAETWPRARELERTAEAYDALYSAFLRRYTDAVQQESFPISNSKIISEAVRPLSPSHPRSFLITTFAALVGSILGVALALIRWHADRTISSPSQVMNSGVRCIATLPWLPKAVASDPRNVVRTVLRSPRSHFTEALRMAHAEISMVDRQRRLRFIGVTSALPGEGKTTIAANLAQLFAASKPTLLIDGDTRSPRMSEAVLPTIPSSHIVAGQVSPWFEPVHSVFGCPTLSFIGIDHRATANHSNWHNESLFEHVLAYATDEYDKVIIDLPPAGGVAEARYIAPLLDAIIIIVESERTPEAAMIACIDACNVEPGKVFGVILNKAHESTLPATYGLAGNYFVPDASATFVDQVRKRGDRA